MRKAWEHEALDFTRWLAQEENLKLLGETIEVDIKTIETEASVGRFNVDILGEKKVPATRKHLTWCAFFINFDGWHLLRHGKREEKTNW